LPAQQKSEADSLPGIENQIKVAHSLRGNIKLGRNASLRPWKKEGGDIRARKTLEKKGGEEASELNACVEKEKRGARLRRNVALGKQNPHGGAFAIKARIGEGTGVIERVKQKAENAHNLDTQRQDEHAEKESNDPLE